MNMALEFKAASKSAHLTPEQVEAFGRRVEEIRLAVMQNLGEEDSKYIYKVRNFVRYTEIASRGMLMFGGWIPPVWLLGTAMLGVSKIVENMELGHNVMHGQFDWLNDPSLRGEDYDWDNTCSGNDWRFANIPLALQLMFFFQWYVGVQNLHLEDALVYKTKTWKQVWADAAEFRKKATRQVLKDYVFFPAIATINFIPVLAGNAVANVIRNLWSSAVIFNGHFTEDAETFEADNTENESKAEWYLRQIRGSSNFTGGKWMHFMSGNLSHQIEHHLFPDMPANRYEQVAPQIRALCAEYGVNYNEANFMKQFWTVWVRLAKCSLPNDMSAQLAQGWTNLKARFKFA